VLTAQAGKRTYFALPSIGTTYIPENSRQRIAFDLSGSSRAFVPGSLDVLVNYGDDLASSERLEKVIPDPLPAQSLIWHEVDAAQISAHGSIVDTVEEERSQVTLYLIGIFAGLVTGFVPMLLSMSVSLIRWTRVPAQKPDSK